MPGVGENAATSEANPNRAIPMRNTRLWPYRSPRVPVPNNRPVMTSGYMLMIHSDSLVLAPRASSSTGTAM